MYKEKKILAVVLARAGSKGIKNKNLRKINRISLVGHAGLFIKKIKFIDKAIISTNSSKIGKVASKYKLNFDFKRPEYLSGPKVSDEKALRHALLEIEKKTKNKFDVIVSLPPTSPLRKVKDVVLSIKKLIDGKYDAVWTVSETDNKFHPHKALVVKNKSLKFFSSQGKRIKYRQQLNCIYHRNGSAYVLTRRTLIKNQILPKNSSYFICKGPCVSIDTIDDLKIAEKILSI